MIQIAITQSVIEHDKYSERRDFLDQRWTDFLSECNFIPTPVPNTLKINNTFLQEINVAGLLLTGGNSLVKNGGDAAERDLLEYQLVDQALANELPVIGVCRGMQLLQSKFDTELKKIPGHVDSRHTLLVKKQKKLTAYLNKLIDVNSFHHFGAKRDSKLFTCVAKSNDGVVMAAEHVNKPVYGIMWHPEREKKFSQFDIQFFCDVFGSKLKRKIS